MTLLFELPYCFFQVNACEPTRPNAKWRNFQAITSKAKIACENAGQVVADHFVDANKMIELASGEPSIAQEDVKNNRDVRKLLTDRHIAPEDLPAAEDVKKLERRLKSEEKKLPRQSARLAGKAGSKPIGK